MDLIGKMVLWTKLWYYGQTYGTLEKNYGTMDKPMWLYRKLWKTMELRFTNEENMVDYQKLYELYNEKTYGSIPNQLKFLNKFIALELWITMENYGTMEKKYGTLEKTMVLYRKLCDVDLPRKKTMVLQ